MQAQLRRRLIRQHVKGCREWSDWSRMLGGRLELAKLMAMPGPFFSPYWLALGMVVASYEFNYCPNEWGILSVANNDGGW